MEEGGMRIQNDELRMKKRKECVMFEGGDLEYVMPARGVFAYVMPAGSERVSRMVPLWIPAFTGMTDSKVGPACLVETTGRGRKA